MKDKKVIVPGDEFTVDFIKNEKGGRPICRVEGIVSFLNDNHRSFIAPGSSWIVRVDLVKDKTLVVTPLVKVATPKENAITLKEKIESLKPEKKERVKEHRTFQYYSKQELKTL